MTRVILIFASAALLLAAGCKPKTKAITSLERKEAANLVSEARFAITLRDDARAEGLLAQAAQLCPDTGDYWLNLGMTRRRPVATSAQPTRPSMPRRFRARCRRLEFFRPGLCPSPCRRHSSRAPA